MKARYRITIVPDWRLRKYNFHLAMTNFKGSWPPGKEIKIDYEPSYFVHCIGYKKDILDFNN